VPKALPRLVLAILLVAACGKGGHKKSARDDAGPTAPVATPLVLPELGVERLTRMNYTYEAGRSAYDKAEAAAKKQDWAEVRKQAELALGKDANHFDAHRLLAIALAQGGENAAAVDHLVAGIAADYLQFGPTYAKEPLLEAFRATQHGQDVTRLAGQIRDEYTKRIAGALWFIGRRSAFHYDKDGVQSLSSRGEVYAFDRETKRYFRLTHTNHQVAGFLRAKAGNELALLGFDKGDRPKDGPPLIARAWVQTIDTTTWQSSMNRITFGPARAIAAYYGEGDQLLVGQASAADRWTLGDWAVSSVDRTTAKLTKVGTPLGAPRIEFSLDEGRVVLTGSADGVTATWAGDPARTAQLAIGSTSIAVPESGQAAQETLAVAPGGGYLAFATAVDPCAKDAAPSLYVANAKSGALKHILTAKSRFATRWIDASTLAYEDGDNGIRLWDATTGREALRIENKAGLALAVLSLASAPLCKQAPPTTEPVGAGSGDEMPPEEGSAGPVTSPQ
jgi:hypothetical protein